GLPGALDAGVVVALLDQRCGARPLAEGRPAVHVAGPCRTAEVEKRLERAVRALLVVRAAGRQRVRRAVAVPRLSAVEISPDELEGGHVGVPLGRPPHGGLRARPLERA